MTHSTQPITTTNVILCTLVGSLVVLSILACSDPNRVECTDCTVTSYSTDALNTSVDVTPKLNEGEILLGVESSDEALVELTKQSDNTLTFKTLAQGRAEISIKTNQRKLTHVIKIMEVDRVELKTQCARNLGGGAEELKYVLPGATLRTKYSLYSSLDDHLGGKGYVTLPISAQEDYAPGSTGFVKRAPESVLTYQVPDDVNGPWTLTAESPESLSVADVTVLAKEDIDAFNLYDLFEDIAGDKAPTVATSIDIKQEADYVLKPMYKNAAVCGLDNGMLTVKTTTPDVCTVEMSTKDIMDTIGNIPYNTVRITGLSAGQCTIEIQKDDGSLWETTTISVR